MDRLMAERIVSASPTLLPGVAFRCSLKKRSAAVGGSFFEMTISGISVLDVLDLGLGVGLLDVRLRTARLDAIEFTGVSSSVLST